MLSFKYFLVLFLFIGRTISQGEFDCPNTCKMEIVETIPDGMENIPHISTYDSWKELIDSATETIEIAAYYFTLQAHYEYDHPTAIQGKQIYESLLEAGTNRNISIKIAKNIDSNSFPNHDTADLVKANAAEVRDVNFTRLIGAGVLHTKMMIVDRKHAYLGSSNFDWRALTQVKEIGITGKNCSCLAADLGKTFDVYWALGLANSTIPPMGWDASFESPFNQFNPMKVNYSGIEYESYVSSAPPQFCPTNRTSDIDAIYDVIDKAEEFIHIAVMDYFPLIMFDGPLRYWPDLDNKLRDASFRNIKVKLLMAKWDNTRTSAENFLRSLQSINGSYTNIDLQVKMFLVPSTANQAEIPFARVNHNKYVVTEKTAYFGTSNWSGDYFISSGGVAVVVTPKAPAATDNDIRTELAKIFERDWNSENAKTIDEIYPPAGQGNSSDNLKNSCLFLLTMFFALSILF